MLKILLSVILTMMVLDRCVGTTTSTSSSTTSTTTTDTTTTATTTTATSSTTMFLYTTTTPTPAENSETTIVVEDGYTLVCSDDIITILSEDSASLTASQQSRLNELAIDFSPQILQALKTKGFTVRSVYNVIFEIINGLVGKRRRRTVDTSVSASFSAIVSTNGQSTSTIKTNTLIALQAAGVTAVTGITSGTVNSNAVITVTSGANQKQLEFTLLLYVVFLLILTVF